MNFLRPFYTSLLFTEPWLSFNFSYMAGENSSKIYRVFTDRERGVLLSSQISAINRSLFFSQFSPAIDNDRAPCFLRNRISLAANRVFSSSSVANDSIAKLTSVIWELSIFLATIAREIFSQIYFAIPVDFNTLRMDDEIYRFYKIERCRWITSFLVFILFRKKNQSKLE